MLKSFWLKNTRFDKFFNLQHREEAAMKTEKPSVEEKLLPATTDAVKELFEQKLNLFIHP